MNSDEPSFILSSIISHYSLFNAFPLFVMRHSGTLRRSPARSSLTYRSVMPMLDASSWASLERPFPRPLRIFVLFGKYCDSFAPLLNVGPCIYPSASGMFLALLSHHLYIIHYMLECLCFGSSYVALARRERARPESPFTTRDPPFIALSPTL